MTRRSFLASTVFAVAKDNGVEWIAFDAAGAIHSLEWRDSNQRISFGSLLKPFLALAYRMTHESFPIVVCSGAATRCWSIRGHGSQDIVNALANSCNTYFLHLSAAVSRPALERICVAYGLSIPEQFDDPGRLIGLGDGWHQNPFRVANAFMLLTQNSGERDVSTVLRGMAQCARTGTGRAVNMRCYVKTGTARWCHGHGGLGDGYTVAAYPLEQPRRVLLVGEHNTTGANAARNVRQIASLVA